MEAGVMGGPRADDQEFEETTVARVEPTKDGGYALTFADGWSFYCPPFDGTPPRIGSHVRKYGRGIGYVVRGLIVDGQTVFYRTSEGQRAKDQADAEKRERERRAEYAEAKADHDKRIDALPSEFQTRLRGFRSRNPDFGWQFEGYELFSCEQAVVIATALGSASEIEAFAKQDWEDQKSRVPQLGDGHSGNTIGVACRLAWLYLSRPDLVPKEHGAMCPLAGCADYGCAAAAS